MADVENSQTGAGKAPVETGAGNLAANPVSDTLQTGNEAPEKTGNENEGGKGNPDAGENGQDNRAKGDPDQQSPDDLPITDWSKVDLGLPKDAAIDENVLTSFGEQACKLGLTPKQARALAAWQLEFVQNAQNELMEAGVAELRKEWGSKAQANQQAVLSLITRIDRKIGNDAFSKALDASGATRHAAVCKGLLTIASMLAEDSLGGGNAATPPKPETALEGIENAFKEMKGKM